MRVGLICWHHESNTFLAQKTPLKNFQEQVLITGPAIRKQWQDAHHEVGGFFAVLDQEGIEAVPLLSASATPSGTVTDECRLAIWRMIEEQLDQAGPLDGVLVGPHGAGVSASEPDLDGWWLTEVRRKVGPKVPVICVIDPHANLTPRIVAACNAITAYRSNPHLDQRQRGMEAASLMVRTLRGEIIPTMAAAYPPIAINIERQYTDAAPCLPMYQYANAMLQRPGVLSNSIVLGFPYADVAEMGSSFIVVTDDDPQLAQQLADELAGYLHAHKEEFRGQLIEVEDAIDQALALDGPVCLLDMGDNVGGGSAADGTFIAHAFHQRKLAGVRCFVALNDPAVALQAQQAGVGRTIDAAVGGKLDDQHGAPLQARFTVVSLHDGKYSEKLPRHGGRTTYDMGLTAILSTDTGLTVQVTSVRTPPFSLQQLLSCHIDPAAHKLLVAKGVNAPVAAYAPVCGERMIRVNTAGVTTADMTKLNYQHRRRPLYPLEAIPAR